MSLYYASASLAEAAIVIVGIPYDRTSSFIPGARLGPAHIRIATDNVESYSPYLQRDLETLRIHDAGDLVFTDMRWEMVAELIQSAVRESQDSGRFMVALGGEHSITAPIVAAHLARHRQLAVVQFDAHADLREDFLGELHSHASVMRRCQSLVGAESVFQYGIRSGTAVEFAQAKRLYPFSVLAGLEESRTEFEGRPIYVTIDVDVLDPGVMPAVATPEPGGISYSELLQALRLLGNCHVVGFDIVEYNPLASRDPASAALVATLLREALLALVH
ncbi:MAG: agmatinase [candidate division WOR-3 bacterium]